MMIEILSCLYASEQSIRLCPYCKVPLIITDLHGESVDRCAQCNGIFFDKGELASLIRMVKFFRELTLEEKDIPSTETETGEKLVDCPNDNASMLPTDFGLAVVDICSECGGVWLDGGEIATLKLAENNIRQNHDLYVRLAQ